jgi:two-component system sensor histidine kinase BarA
VNEDITIQRMKKRILIIEEERAVRQFLAAAMDGGDCELVWTQTAHEALRRSLDEHFDLILLDLNVTDMDAWRALNWFCVLRPLRPVVMLTERADQSRRAEVFGATLVLQKPLDQTRLLETVTRLLNEPHGATPSEFAVARDWREYAE